MVIVGHFVARQLCMGLGYIYPLYASVEALRTRREHELLQWITFWAVNAIFWVLETVGDTIISWLPFYLEAKIVALAWLVLPSYRGALYLHQKWVAPAFQQHEQVIDFTIADLKRRAGEKMVQMCKDTAGIALRNSSDVVAQSQQFIAAQLVQQALSKLQSAAPTDVLRLPFSAIAKTEVRAKETANRSEKPNQVLEHFKKLMMQGFQLQYHPSVGVIKNRALLLDSRNSRYVSFLSAKETKSSVDCKKKAARLLLHNLRRVATATAEECVMIEQEQVDAKKTFLLDNGKAVMVFEAESQKSRDLLVAGLRLLIAEHKKRDTIALIKLRSALDKFVLQRAFAQLKTCANEPVSRK